MERDPSGTDGQQYWQPEGRHPDGYGQAAAQPDHATPAYDPSVYNPGAYQQESYGSESYPRQSYQQQSYPQGQYTPDAYTQSGYQQAGYPQAAYPQTPPAYPGAENGQAYYPTQQYAAPQYPAEATAQWSSGAAYDYGSQPQQGYYPDAGYQDTSYQATNYQNAGYQTADDQSPGYQTAGYESPGYQTASYSGSPYVDPGHPQQTPDSSGAGPAGSADPTSAEEPRPDLSETPGDTPAGRSGRRRDTTGSETGGTPEPAPDGPLLPRLLAAATGRAPGTNRRTFLIRASIGGVALLVVAAAGIAVAGGGGGTNQPAAAARVQANLASGHSRSWAAPAEAAATGSTDGLVGSWITAHAVVRGDGMGVTAYDTASGSKLWTAAPPTPGAVPCAMSPTANSAGLGAVLFQPKSGTNQPCTALVLVDTATGKTDWQAKIAPATAAYGASVMVNDTRADVVGDTGAAGYDIATGKQSWTYAGPGKYCALAGSGTAGVLLLQSTCADTTPKQQAITLDAGSGHLGWWRGLPQNAASYTVLAATPAVVAVHMADSTQDTIMSFTDKGDTQATISSGQTAGRLDTTHGSFDPMPALFFQNGTVYAALTPPDGAGTASTGVIAAFSLADGKQLWQATPKEKGRCALVGLDGSAAVVATEERLGQPARLGHYDLATGKESPGGGFSQGTGSLLTSSRVLYQSNFVAALPEFTSTYNSAATGFTASH